MTDLDALLAAILANPADDAARLVYADKIEERDQPGDAERAEFIRVQVQDIPGDQCEKCSGTGKHKRGYCDAFMYGCDEFGDDDCSHNNELINCGECASLRKRERELFNANCDKWFPVPPGYGFDWAISLCPDDNDARPSYIVRRGFVAEVRGRMEKLVGGECEECQGRGLRTIYGDGSGPWLKCQYCTDGRVPGVLPAIAQAHPVEWVRATDAKPQAHPPSNPYEYGWCYTRTVEPFSIPREIWDLLKGGDRSGPSDRWIDYPTEHDALVALSRALIAWARKEQT